MNKSREGRAEMKEQGQQGLPAVAAAAAQWSVWGWEELTFLTSQDAIKACDQTMAHCCPLLSKLESCLRATEQIQ